MNTLIPLSDAKSRLSEIVRNVRRGGEPVTITVDGEAAARLVPVESEVRDLTTQEASTSRALFFALRRLSEDPAVFDAVELVSEGRR